MNENKTEKLARTCNTTRKIVKILRILSYIAIALFVFVAAVGPMFMVGQVEGVEFTIDGQPTDSFSFGEIMTRGAFAVSALAIGSVVMLMCEKVLSTVNTESTPFVPENVKRIKTIAILTACSSVVPSWISQIVSVICGGKELLMEVEVTMIVLALVVWCVALIFEYGVTLQEREDETL